MSFDRAADYYDATRALPGASRDALADVLAAELTGAGRCLEVGVGTGRIALPLHARGVPLVGSDIAATMLARLVANAGGSAPFPLVLADAGRLPFGSAAYDAVLFCHVLHLLTDWRAAVDEAGRVVAPGGALLIDFGGIARLPWHEWCVEIFRRHGIEQRRPGVSAPEEVAAHLGITAEPLPPVAVTFARALAEDLDGWEQQRYSWTWLYDRDQMHAAVADIRIAAAERGWSVDEPATMAHPMQWWRFRVPSTA